ncbi:MAG: NAD(P)H-dependent oxidoreductase [Chloroflexota bacterium]
MPGQLLQLLATRNEAGRPLRVGLIGAGKFGTMFLSQAAHIPGLHLLGVADVTTERARAAMQRAEWPAERHAARTFAEALKTGTTCLTDDGEKLIAAEGMEVVIEATGIPGVGIKHALSAIENGRHIVMVNVEADVLAGPLLAERAAAAGTVYSMAYGDQPALICDLVEWARGSGFSVVCAGKGTRFLPIYHTSTPETVWRYNGFPPERIARGEDNPRLFNSFIDGTKSAIEMAAVANATGLVPQPEGVTFPPCGADDLPHVCRPRADGGHLSHKGTVEVVSSLERDGRPVYRDLRYGVFVTFEAPNEFTMRSMSEYGLRTDSTGRYGAMYRSHHLVGMELSISALRVGLLGQSTGSPTGFRGDVVAVAKRDLAEGETLDGEGGFCVFGRLMPAQQSLASGGLPIGLAHGVKLLRPVRAGDLVGWADVRYEEADATVRIRREMERRFAEAGGR